MPRPLVEGVPVGCPILDGKSGCHPCAGGWPGTTSPGEKLIKAVQKGILDPSKLGCAMLQLQGEFLVKHFSNNHKDK